MTSSTSSSSQAANPLIAHNLVDTKKYFCPFLERGYCREASRCNFSHDNCKSVKIPSDYCHFYLANQCLYTLDCKFRHDEPPPGPPQRHQQQSRVQPEHTFRDSSATLYAEDYPDDYEEDESIYQDSSPESHHLNTAIEQQSAGTHQPPNLESTCEPTPGASNFNQASVEELSSRFSASLPSISSTSHHHHRPTTSSTTATTNATNSNTTTATFSYAKVCRNRLASPEPSNSKKNLPLCPYTSETGECEFPTGHCSYLHGLACDLCGRHCLHPYDPQQQRQHRDDCLKEHEREMELSFAIQRSKDKICGICMETVVEKKPITSSRFGILEKCNHIFCLSCIRKWRGTKQFETRTIRACPECRVSSDFVVPSKYWIEDQDDKDKLIGDYKVAMQSKSCKYFNEGKGECPFAGSCFYKHAYPDGSIAKMDTPKPKRRVFGARGPTTTVANYILWNILTSTDEEEWTDEELGSIYDDLESVDLWQEGDWEPPLRNRI